MEDQTFTTQNRYLINVEWMKATLQIMLWFRKNIKLSFELEAVYGSPVSNRKPHIDRDDNVTLAEFYLCQTSEEHFLVKETKPQTWSSLQSLGYPNVQI